MVGRGTMGAGLLLLAVLPARAQLEWKFKEGDKFRIEAITETKQTVTAADKPPASSTSTYTTLSTFVVKKAGADSYTLQQTIDGVQVKSNKSDDPTTALASRFANLLKGASFTFTLSPAGKLTSSLDGYDDLIKKLSGGNENLAKGMKAMISEDAFKEELNLIFGFLPAKSVAKGDSWSRKESLATPWGKLTGEATYTYKDQDGELIAVNHKLTYERQGEGVGGVTVTKAEVTVSDATGSIVADPAAGRFISHKQTLHITGQLTTTDPAKKDTAFKIDQTTTRTIRRLDAPSK